MVNTALREACKNFFLTSIEIINTKVKNGLVIPNWRPFVRTFDEKGGITSIIGVAPIYEFDLFTIANEVYFTKEANALVDFLLDNKIIPESLIPSNFSDEKAKASAKDMIRYNYIGSFLIEYFSRIGSVKFDEEIFDKIYNEFETFFSLTKIKYLLITPVWNFESEVNEIDLGEGLKIKAITTDEFIMLQRLARSYTNSFSFNPISINDILSIKFVIEEEYEADPSILGGNSNRKTEMLITALRTNKLGALHYDMSIQKSKFWKVCGGLVILGRSQTKNLFGTPYKLSASEASTFKAFWSSFKKFNLNQHKFLEVAIKRLNYSYDRSKAEDKVIDSFVALEAMFLTGSEKSELSYRLSVRIATFLGNSSEDKNHIFSDIRKAYKTRSDIVHGDSAVNQSDIAEISPKIEEYTRRSLKRFLELLSSKSYSSIIDSIDSNIFT